LRTIANSTKTPTLQRDVPQSVTVVTQQLMQDQLMLSLADVVRYVPGITAIKARTIATRDHPRHNSSADFFSTVCATTCRHRDCTT
jgi:catecholate siderophore receptor